MLLPLFSSRSSKQIANTRWFSRVIRDTMSACASSVLRSPCHYLFKNTAVRLWLRASA
ncbi:MULTISPECIES: hypothetical protein [Candidatus Ichthyocystis]|uniref:hypothetical protein n=1 Tax=Candidatus Ichthyocystis TaxID=2929841 RepID=UPI001F5E655E|nr:MULTISPECIES: hypothetical protein [Ichthyocystis]